MPQPRPEPPADLASLRGAYAMLRELYQWIAGLDAERRVEGALELGRRTFGARAGLLLRDDGDAQEIVALAAPDDPGFRAGDRITPERARSLGLDPGAGLRALVKAGGESHGTLYFPGPISAGEPERDFLHLLAEWIGTTLAERQAADYLARAREQLEVSQRLASIGTLATGIAHEINNPITSILVAAQYALLCRDDPNGREIARHSLERIVANAKRCGHIVQSLLKFARQETSDKWPSDVNACVVHAEELTHEYARAHAVSVQLDLDPLLPPVLLNPTEIEQVLVNLVRNAVEAEAREITLRTRSGGPYVRIEVLDDGRGVAPEHQPRIFDPFYTTRERCGGTGLGLSVAHTILTQHDGTIRCESSPGAGAVFTVELPAAKAAPSAEASRN